MTETAAEADGDESLDAYIDAVQDRINVDLHENGFLSQNIPGTAEARAFLSGCGTTACRSMRLPS